MQSRRIETHKELHVVARTVRRVPTKSDPQSRIIRFGAAVSVLANACQRAAALRRAVKIPAVNAFQNRIDVTRRQCPAQFEQRFTHRETIAFALTVHPPGGVVLGQFFEKLKCVPAEASESWMRVTVL